MKCPFCGFLEDKVLDSRTNKDGTEIRRRRACLNCNRRFSTREIIELSYPLVIKKDGKREPFSSEKIKNGLKKALEKRPISADKIDEIVKRIENAVIENGEQEVSTQFIGELVMRELRKIDHVAYVRFASVYKDFKDPSQFIEELEKLLKKSSKK
ncbi:MAG: transcriptional regulator NrdR [Proteobacteria bacterium]|nr:transcriptional regulator NrdR [Pseudomonadota bacterium]